MFRHLRNFAMFLVNFALFALGAAMVVGGVLGLFFSMTSPQAFTLNLTPTLVFTFSLVCFFGGFFLCEAALNHMTGV